MRKSRLSEDETVENLREADKTSVAEMAKKHGVAEQTIYIWRQRFGKLDPADVKRLRRLEQENGRLKKNRRRAGPRNRGHERDRPKKPSGTPATGRSSA